MSTPSPPSFWSPDQSTTYAILTTCSSSVTMVSTLISFVLIYRDRKWSRYPLTSRALISVFVGDFVYALTSILGAAGYFSPIALFDDTSPKICVAWGSFIYFGHNLVFFSLLLFFLCSLADPGDAPWTNRLRDYFVPAAFIPVVMAAVFQVIWAVSYDESAVELIRECGADNCLEVIHLDSSENPGYRFLYLLPLLITMVTCPILVFFTVRSVRSMVKKTTGSYTDRDRKETRRMININAFYLATFYFCFWPNIVEFFYSFRGTDCHDGLDQGLYWLYLSQALFNPLHGFWNAFIFVWRPRILRSQSHHQPLLSTT